MYSVDQPPCQSQVLTENRERQESPFFGLWRWFTVVLKTALKLNHSFRFQLQEACTALSFRFFLCFPDSIRDSPRKAIVETLLIRLGRPCCRLVIFSDFQQQAPPTIQWPVSCIFPPSLELTIVRRSPPCPPGPASAPKSKRVVCGLQGSDRVGITDHDVKPADVWRRAPRHRYRQHPVPPRRVKDASAGFPKSR